VTEPGTARIGPLPREQWDDEVRAAIGSGMPEKATARFLSTGPDGMRPPNVLTTLMHHPRLAGPWLTYNAVLLRDPTLEPRVRELLVLRVAWCTRAEYEWVQHVRLAPRVGISPEEIEAVTRGADDEAWSPLEADLLRAADQLLAGFRVDDDLWARLSGHFNERELVELVFVVGTYTCLAMAFNSFGMQLDPELIPNTAPPLPAS
jgi:4-carboxymuconolactone decarboxylase